MKSIPFVNNSYRTCGNKRSFLGKLFPTVNFYIQLIAIVLQASRLARRGKYDGSSWIASSLQVFHQLENAGVTIDISGIENLMMLDGPAVIVGNHMSMMETLLLPGIVHPVRPATFVVKEALLEYPVFKYVIRSRHPIAVTRTNPRLDLKTVLSEGVEKLQKNISIIVFPQTTRSHSFDPSQMSSIAVKLAKKAGVPVLPIALKTDCWRNGRKFKDFGKLDLSKTAYFSFGKPLNVTGKGDVEQAAINTFIADKLKSWEDR